MIPFEIVNKRWRQWNICVAAAVGFCLFVWEIDYILPDLAIFGNIDWRKEREKERKKLVTEHTNHLYHHANEAIKC